MDRKRFLYAFVALCGLIAGAFSEAEIFMEISQRYAKEGENITITCEISGIGSSTPLLLKMTSDAVKEPISVNEELVGEYQNPGRFVLTKLPVDNGAFVKLTIINVRHEDTGIYECRLPSDADRKTITFEVYRNTEQLAFYVNGTMVANNTVIDVEEGQAIPLSCSASKSVPRPEMHILSGNRDITDRFSEAHQLVSQCEKDENCLLHFYYNTSSSNSMYKASWEENSQNLVCKAMIKMKDPRYGNSFGTIQTNIKLNVSHAPVVNCSTSTIYAALGETKVFTCPVYSNPAIESEKVILRMADGTKYRPGEDKNGITFKFSEDTQSPNKGKVEVIWSKIDNRHIIDYTVEASNVMGDTSYTFKVFKGAPTNPPYNGASMKRLSVFSIALMAIVAMFKH
jgi:hypothetical protein